MVYQPTIIFTLVLTSVISCLINPMLSTGISFLVIILARLSFVPCWLHWEADYTVSFLSVDSVSYALVVLTILIVLLAFSARIATITGPSGTSYIFLINGLGAAVVLRFTASRMIHFYLLFEGSLIPIFLIVIGWGYQPERLRAAFALFFYTFVASLPLLLIMVLLTTQFSEMDFNLLNLSGLFSSSASFTGNCLQLFTLIAFLVKLPVFLVHQWLPKAHVEAPVAGSMILAAILLKLGGYGLIRFSPVLAYGSRFLITVVAGVLIGGGLIGLLCLRQLDLKVLIAYSSVRHIAFVAAGFLVNSVWAFSGALLIIIAHGVCSSGIFAGANIIYLRSASRLMTLNKGILSYLPAFSLIWFLLCLGNIGGPPTVNLVREIMSIVGFVNFNSFSLVPVAFITFLAAAYTLVLYRNSQHGLPSLGLRINKELSSVEFHMIRMHVIWLLLLPLSLSLVIYTNITFKFFYCRDLSFNCSCTGLYPIEEDVSRPKKT